jgi:hypothetical protein
MCARFKDVCVCVWVYVCSKLCVYHLYFEACTLLFYTQAKEQDITRLEESARESSHTQTEKEREVTKLRAELSTVQSELSALKKVF